MGDSATGLITAEEFAEKHGGDYLELIDGRVVATQPGGARNGLINGFVIHTFGEYLYPRRRWVVCSNDTYVLTRRNPDRVRGGDLVVWRQEVIPEPMPELIVSPPELVVEVKRPFDTVGDVLRKAIEYIDGGVRVVLVLYPEDRSASVFRRDRPPEALSSADELTLADIFPGFAAPISDFFC